jgi:predicted phosphoadenosine phosphosulfate sulfurtransferase
MAAKRGLGLDVRRAAEARLGALFDEFEHVCVSFSGGKDSTVLLELARREALRRGRVVDVLFIDWEAQYQGTIAHVAQQLAQPGVRPIWVCLPLTTDNASSFHEPLWTAWDPARQAVWVRDLPDAPGVVSDVHHWTWYRPDMTFEAFLPAFSRWYGAQAGGRAAFLVGLRAQESLHRYATVRRSSRERENYGGRAWSTRVVKPLRGETHELWNFYPIYDWQVEDVWRYHAETGLHVNRVYELMHLAGLSAAEMRIDEPFGPEARKNLGLIRRLEPDTWGRLVLRVQGANFGARRGQGELFAHRGQFVLPPGYPDWKSYAGALLDSLPPPLQAHYRGKIEVFVAWFARHRGWSDLNDVSEERFEQAGTAGSWRNVAITLLKNDYWCQRLSFGVTVKDAARTAAVKERYADL